MDSRILCIDRANSKAKLAEIYTAADLFLNPSIEETMGLTIVEAMACGTNVLVSNSTALPEIVDYDKEKILPNQDICLVVEKALKMQCNRNENRRNADKYEKNQQYLKYVDLYAECLR